jgi:Tol biopolymer transport system component
VTNYSGLIEGLFSQSKTGNDLVFYKARRKDTILIADINRVTGELGKATPLRSEGWNADAPLWTSDGRKLAFYSNPRGEPGFYIEDLQTQEIQPLVAGIDRESDAALTSDGKWLLFTRPHIPQSADAPLELMRMPLDGGPASPLLTGNILFQCALRRAICALSEAKNNQRSFFELDPINGRGALFARVQNLDLLTRYDWDVSPDGRNLAYLPKWDSNQIGILSMEGKNSRTITVEGGHLQSPAWAADNEHLYVVSLQQGKWNMLYVEPRGKYKTAWTSLQHVWIARLQPSPDGSRLAFQQRTWEGNFAMLQNY